MDDAMRMLQSKIDTELIEEILSLRSDVARFKGEHGQACKTIAQMHAAALGEVCGPIRGVVEDVADLRESFEKKSAEAYRARVRVNQSELREETLRREFAELEKERDELKKRASDTLGTVCRLMADGEELEQERDNLRAALDAADRLAEMVRQHAAQNAGYGASSDITTGDIGQEYEFYRAARAAVGKAGGD